MSLIGGISANFELNSLFIISAFVLGALHALEPGHGKSVMAAFVMGTHADLKDTVLLGLTVVFSHVVVVIVFAVIAVFLLKNLDVNTTHDVMSIIAGIILILVGLWIIRKFYHPHHNHEHNNHKHNAHEHNIDTTNADTTKGVIAIGLSTGLVPCPAALAVLLFSLSNNQIYNGIVYVLIFSMGLAISITVLSILFVKSKDFLKRYIHNKSINKITFLSGAIIMTIGIITILEPLIHLF